MSFGYGTPILTPGGHRAIESLAVGDPVSAARLSVERSVVKLIWSERRVTFSNGTPPAQGKHSPMVYVQCGVSHVVCSSDEPFLLSSGKLKRAAKLTPADKLVDRNGDPTTIVTIRLIDWEGGVHHIATGPYQGSPDGHLVLANGVTCGDYALQQQSSPDTFEDRPAIGTPEYRK